MRVILVRHARVLVEWKKRYSSAAYDGENAHYDRASIGSLDPMDFGVRKVYISRLSRSAATAAFIVGASQPEVTDLLDEVPIRSFKDTGRELPTWLWNLGATLQWLRGSRRQREAHSQTRERASAFLDLLESRGEDCVVVGHGIHFFVLMKLMKGRGYSGRIKRYMRNGEAREFDLDLPRPTGGTR
jgi:broad specificity phosphatase PhoE